MQSCWKIPNLGTSAGNLKDLKSPKPLEVENTLTVPLSGSVTVPGRTLSYEFVGNSKDLEGLLITTLNDTAFIWTPGKMQGGTHTIAIQVTDGTTTAVQTIRITVQGGENLPDTPGVDPPPDTPLIPFKLLLPTFEIRRFDFDGSLIVDLADFTQFAAAFGTDSWQFDFDGSKRVDFRDFLLFAYFFNKKVNVAVYVRTPARDQVPFVEVDGGSFIKEINGHFWEIFVLEHKMSQHEITNRQYRLFWENKFKVLALTPQPFNRIGFEERAQKYPEHPVVGVTWEMASEYCKWVGGRLPTELEWAFAARGTGLRRYAHGAQLDPARANYLNSGDPFESETGTTPVAFYNGRLYQGFQTTDSYSLYGAYDMTGNVWEWCADTLDDLTPPQAIIMGGSYRESALSSDLQIGLPTWIPTTERRENVGFRCLIEQ